MGGVLPLCREAVSVFYSPSRLGNFYIEDNLSIACPIGCCCRIHRLHLCRRVGPPPPTNECPDIDTKRSNAEFPVMLELWGMWSTPSLSLLPGPLWPRMVAPDKVLCMGQIELICVLVLNRITWNRTVFIFKLRTYAKLNYLK